MLQFDGHQIHFTSLIEFQVKREAARSHLVLTHYTEFSKEKGIVLMTGDFVTEFLNAEEARWLAHEVQKWYVIGGERKQQVLENFWKNPSTFDYKTILDESQSFE